jgi:hypothetical protein
LAEVTAPESAAAFCAKAGAEVCSTSAVSAAAEASNIVFIRMEPPYPDQAWRKATPTRFNSLVFSAA